MNRVTAQEREEQRKREKQNLNSKKEEEEVNRSLWAKYTFGLKHQVIFHAIRILILWRARPTLS